MNDLEDRLKEIVNNALKRELTRNDNENTPFLDIEDYKRKTGKRFRRTREQMEAGLTKEQAFQQFMEEMMDK